VLVKGPTKTSVRTADSLGNAGGGIQVDLRVIASESYGAALLYFTGSKQHNVALRERAIKQGFKLNEYGLYKGDKPIAGETEEQVYQALGLAWVPPALREDRGELRLAESGQLPKLIEPTDILAELHAHTVASDGRWSIRELVMAAVDRGFHTVAVTDHSRSQPIANGLSIERMEQHIEDVRTVAQQFKGTITVLAGSEVDILSDGSLDYPNYLLKQLDIVVASPHNALGQDPAKATKRLIKAIENPYVTLIGHPTGRLINRREGLSPDMKRVVAAAAARGIALEINANNWRLDLNDINARAAIDAGVKLAINTDAHGPGDMDQLIFGVLTARRAGATKDDVVNCMSADKLQKWLKSTRF
jgi:DNA polymerase (family 10)